MSYQSEDILERGNKAVEDFTPLPFGKVDKDLREATKRTGEELVEALKKEVSRMEHDYA